MGILSFGTSSEINRSDNHNYSSSSNDHPSSKNHLWKRRHGILLLRPFLSLLSIAIVLAFTVNFNICSTTTTRRTTVPPISYVDSTQAIDYPTYLTVSTTSANVCRSNPYLGALNGSVTEIAHRMERWLQELPRHQQRASSSLLHEHTHERFFAFDDTGITTCTSVMCVGGPCRADASKMVCGLDQLTLNTTEDKGHHNKD